MRKVIALIGLVAAFAMVSEAYALVPQLTLKWAFNTSAVFPGKTFGAGHQGCQTVWDIDGDGVNEVMFGTRRGDSRRMWVIAQDGKFKWVYPPIGQDPLTGDPWGVSLVDVNKDGKYEACISGRGGKLHVIKGDGTPLWIWDNPTAGVNMLGPPQAYDVDGDGYPEFFMADGPGFVHRVDHTGKLVWTSFQAGNANEGHVTIADIDRDGVMEVLWASQDFNLYCIDSTNGQEEWRFDAGANMQTNANLVADVNNDGEYEAVIWTDAPVSSVIIVSFYGTELGRWTLSTSANIRLTPAFGDVNKDGSMDMAFVSGAGVHVIDIGKTPPRTIWEANVTKWAEQGLVPAGVLAADWSNYPIIADFDGDGKLEILWLLPYPIVTDAATGTVKAYYLNEHINVGARQENGGWWGDVDKDGKSEWICEVNGKSHPQTQVYCLTMNGKFPAESPWPEYVHSAYPAAYQAQQSWLTLKGAYSKSMWILIPEGLVSAFAALMALGLLWRRR